MIDTIKAMFESIKNIGIIDVIDIVVVCILIYQVFKVVKKTRANQVIKGLVVLLVMAVVSSILQMKILSWLLSYIIQAGAVIIVVLFQPELRRGLEKIGRNKIFDTRQYVSYENMMVYEKAINELVNAVQNLSKTKTGALLVLANKTGMGDVENTGTKIDASISAALIQNIFEPNTPLHDGAVIIQKERISAAGCFLPLSSNVKDKELGTRHRAGMGISEETDATVIIVSEETGVISVVVDGEMTRYVDLRKLREFLEKAYGFNKQTAKSKTSFFVRREKHGTKRTVQ